MTTDALTAFASSDPDFVDFFGAFAFTETANASNLAATDRHVVQLGALVGGGSVETFEAALEAALDDTLTPIQAKEIVYQAAAYAGAGRTLAFLTATNDALRRRGVTLPLPSQRTTSPMIVWRWDARSRGRSLGQPTSTVSTPTPPRTRFGSSVSFPRTALATTTPATASRRSSGAADLCDPREHRGSRWAGEEPRHRKPQCGQHSGRPP